MLTFTMSSQAMYSVSTFWDEPTNFPELTLPQEEYLHHGEKNTHCLRFTVQLWKVTVGYLGYFRLKLENLSLSLIIPNIQNKAGDICLDVIYSRKFAVFLDFWLDFCLLLGPVQSFSAMLFSAVSHTIRAAGAWATCFISPQNAVKQCGVQRCSGIFP